MKTIVKYISGRSATAMCSYSVYTHLHHTRTQGKDTAGVLLPIILLDTDVVIEKWDIVKV